MEVSCVHKNAAFALIAYRAGIKRAQAQLETFQQNAPAYNSSLFQGKGIVIMAGGLTYFVPAWINIHMLRKAGMQRCLVLLLCRPLKQSPGTCYACNLERQQQQHLAGS